MIDPKYHKKRMMTLLRRRNRSTEVGRILARGVFPLRTVERPNARYLQVNIGSDFSHERKKRQPKTLSLGWQVVGHLPRAFWASGRLMFPRHVRGWCE
jgi:hypothetical protein